MKKVNKIAGGIEIKAVILKSIKGLFYLLICLKEGLIL